MTIKHFIAVLAVAGCSGVSLPDLPSLPKLPDLPSLPSFSFAGEGVKERPAIGCDAAIRLNLQALDWANAKRLDLHVRNSRFRPETLVIKLNTPNVITVLNGGGDAWTFRAPEFFRSAAISRIIYDGREVPETCIEGIRIGPAKGAELHVVPLRKGEYPFGDASFFEFPLGPFATPGEVGQIIVR